MKSVNFKPLDSISILSLLYDFKIVCNSNDVVEAAAMWLFQLFMKDSAKPALAHRVTATKEDDSQQEGKLTPCCQVVTYALSTYPTD